MGLVGRLRMSCADCCDEVRAPAGFLQLKVISRKVSFPGDLPNDRGGAARGGAEGVAK